MTQSSVLETQQIRVFQDTASAEREFCFYYWKDEIQYSFFLQTYKNYYHKIYIMFLVPGIALIYDNSHKNI